MILIDTNIAYYLSGISNDRNFNIELFKKDKSPKLISSISLIEIYLKNNIKDFKNIMKILYENKINAVIYGININTHENITIKKLFVKPNSYIVRIMSYLKEIYSGCLARNLVYLGFLIGAMYVYLLELYETDIKPNKLKFDFVCLNKSENEIIDLLKKDIDRYFLTKDTRDLNFIFMHVRNLTLMAIVEYKYKNDKRDKVQIFEEVKRIDLDCYKLMQDTCKKRNLKVSYIINQFDKCFGKFNLDFAGIKNIVEYFFLTDRFQWNDFDDFMIISVAEKIKNCSVLTSDKHWQKFIKFYADKNNCANLSAQTLLKFYKKNYL